MNGKDSITICRVSLSTRKLWCHIMCLVGNANSSLLRINSAQPPLMGTMQKNWCA